MELGLQQNLTLTQQLVMTPQLQQAIKLLQLSRIELAEMIQQEMEQNPALEEQSPLNGLWLIPGLTRLIRTGTFRSRRSPSMKKFSRIRTGKTTSMSTIPPAGSIRKPNTPKPRILKPSLPRKPRWKAI
jgi:DNA-directed RNA polymerase specialized sigma54-like protein